MVSPCAFRYIEHTKIQNSVLDSANNPLHGIVLLEKFSQQIPRLLWDLKCHYRFHKSPPLGPILCQKSAVHNFTAISLRSILILSYHLRLGLPSSLFQVLDKNDVCISVMRAICPALLTLLDLFL